MYQTYQINQAKLFGFTENEYDILNKLNQYPPQNQHIYSFYLNKYIPIKQIKTKLSNHTKYHISYLKDKPNLNSIDNIKNYISIHKPKTKLKELIYKLILEDLTGYQE